VAERKKYSSDVKAAVIADVLADLTFEEAAKKYNVPRGTIASWVSRTDAPELHKNAIKQQEIGDKILSYLAKVYETLQKQLEVMGNESWLKQQSASQVAELHNTLNDNAVRLLEAIEPSNESEDV